MRDITIYRHEDGTARGIVCKKRGEYTREEVDPPGAVFLILTPMPNEFCEYVQNATQDKVHKLLDSYIPKYEK